MASDKFLEYNCLDSACTLEARNKFWKDLDQGFKPAYDMTMAIFEPLMFMMTRGIKVDLEALEVIKVEIKQAAEEKQLELNRLCGRDLNVNSPKDCQTYFYIEKGIPPYHNEEGGITVDDQALQRIARGTSVRRGLREAKLVQEIRGLNKLSGTYLEIEFDSDQRIRCSYNPRGTKFGRLSSSTTIFGTGTNLQNLPQEFKKFLVADEGYILWEVDKRQAEWVVVAYLAKDASMIKVHEENLDAHTYTASMMFVTPEDLIKLESKLVGLTTDPDEIASVRSSEPGLHDFILRLPRSMSGRQAGKKCLPGTTEVLTPTGWIRLNELTTQHLIAQWDNNKLTFTNPSNISMYEFSGDLISLESNHIRQDITEDHRLPIVNDRTNSLEVILARDYKPRTHWHMPISGQLDNKQESELKLTPMEARLLVAIQADGSIDSYKNLILRVDKENKVSRAEWILSALALRFTRTNRGFFIHNSNQLAVKIATLLGDKKLFSSYLLVNDLETLDAFLWETTRWDGYSPKGQYFTTVDNNAYWVQTIAHITGGRATVKKRPPTGFGKKPLYWVNISRQNNTSLVSIKKSIRSHNGFVYCPTVSSGFFLIRHEGKISITGNSNHGLNYDEGPNRFAITNEIEQSESKRIIELYHRVYPGIRQTYHESVKRQLQADRTLTNCFGRKVRFLDAWGPDLWKAGYSMLPQSTVVDSLNKGMVGIYSNDSICGTGGIDLLAQTHDSILLQIPVEWFQDERFNAARELVYKEVSPEIEYGGRKFHIATDSKIGLNWGVHHPERNPQGMREIQSTPEAIQIVRELCPEKLTTGSQVI
jgi:DNA polymerase I-like protein with 3'-5' exonuclease and polymerase domains